MRAPFSSKNKTTWTIILLLLMLMGMIASIFYQADIHRGERNYEAVAEMAEEIGRSDGEKMIAALQDSAPDAVGYINIEGTDIAYPLMYGAGNEYYLHHTWDGERNAVGSIFIEECCSGDMSDVNTIIYGHNMKDGSMFAPLHLYAEIDFWQVAPRITITTGKGVFEYLIFAAYEARVRDITYALNIEDREIKERFLSYAQERSLITTEIIPDLDDKFLTLSTCTGRGYATRWVVQAVLENTVSQI